MKFPSERISMLAIVASLVLLLGGCLGGGATTKPTPPGDTGQMQVLLELAEFDWRNVVKKAVYELKPAVGAARQGELTIGSSDIKDVFSGLPVGEWTVTVVLYDQSNAEIGRGTATATVTKDALRNVHVPMHIPWGFTFTAEWRSEDPVVRAHLNLTHTRTRTTVDQDGLIGGLRADFGFADLLVGEWGYRITLYDDNNRELAHESGTFNVVWGEANHRNHSLTGVADLELRVSYSGPPASATGIRVTFKHLTSGATSSGVYPIPDHRPDMVKVEVTLPKGEWCAVAEMVGPASIHWGQTTFDLIHSTAKLWQMQLYLHSTYPIESCMN